MRKSRRWAFALAVLFIFPFVLAGCGDNGDGPETGGETGVEADFETKTYADNRYIRMFGDYPPAITEYNLKIYKELGLTDFCMTNVEPENIAATMALIEEYGLNVLVGAFEAPFEDPEYETIFNRRYKSVDFAQFPSYNGIYIIDEPRTSHFNYIRDSKVSWYNETYAGRPGSYWYLNLMPSYASSEQLESVYDPVTGRTAYEVHVDEYVNTVLKAVQGPKNIGLDHYALRDYGGRKTMSDTLLFDLAVVAAAARDNGADFSNCIQTYTDNGGARLPTSVAEIRFQLFASMVFGARAFEFFCYSSDARQHFNAMFEGGKPTDLYYYVQEAIAEVQLFENVYCHFNYEGFVTLNGTNNGAAYESDAFMYAEKYAMNALNGVKNVTATEDTLIGQLKDDGGDKGYVVLNYNDPAVYKADKVRLEFDGGIEKVVVYRYGEETKYLISGGVLELPLSPGEGVFVIPVR
ncbi:hypothetical protein FACS1894211_15750 [Clostridia bacterium]|nr:hypothetical protein FACS1894211_15750 [Clostridia bacterium]